MIPKSWGDSLYNYTYKTLKDLEAIGLLPDMVQVGNETNIDILQDSSISLGPINWGRNASLLNRGIAAVRDVANESGKEIEIMLHIAQPENALWWFEQAWEENVRDFDWIGISYYSKWSTYQMSQLSGVISQLVDDYGKKLMVVETAYPYILENQDEAGNILWEDALVPAYPATEEGQYEYLKALETEIKEGGGHGWAYWEPAWVSTNCSTRWGKGSHWDNAVMFDAEGKPLKSMDVYGE